MPIRSSRAEFFQSFADALIESSSGAGLHFLELGSGFGNLTKFLLHSVPRIENYVALDASAEMHDLAQRQLGPLAKRVQFVERRLNSSDWSNSLGTFDAVVTYQTLHQLGHKEFALKLHCRVKNLLKPTGVFLVCDHYAGDGGMKNHALYMTVQEQRFALMSAGFSSVNQHLLKGGLVLHRAAI